MLGILNHFGLQGLLILIMWKYDENSGVSNTSMLI